MASSITPDIAGLRALSHPVRLRMLGLLRTEGPATATTLAQRLGLNTGATSYHLRQLAQHGFIEEDTERGNGRDRWWRAAHDSHPAPTSAEKGSTDEDVEAYLTTVALLYGDKLRAAVAEMHGLRPSGARSGPSATGLTPLTPRPCGRPRQGPRPGWSRRPRTRTRRARPQFVVNLNAFPRPGTLGYRVSHGHPGTRRAPLVGGPDRRGDLLPSAPGSR